MSWIRTFTLFLPPHLYRSKMDLVLTPLRLELSAFADLCVPKKITLFEKIVWHYKVAEIVKNIFDKKKKDEDPSPPDIEPLTINKRRKRSGDSGCQVEQVSGRPYYYPAFKLEMYANDEVSDVELSYAIGTHRGGTNIQEWTSMGGNMQTVPAELPGGIPLYWSVKAKNSQGLQSVAQCALKTYDGTLPDGRVEHVYTYSSHPKKLFASVIVFDDSPLLENQYSAVGFNPGKFGSQLIDWSILRLGYSQVRNNVQGPLKHFSLPRDGKLAAFILQSTEQKTAEQCAEFCMNYGSNCISFDYETHSRKCDLHDVVDGQNAYLKISGTYKNYERFSTGYHAPLEFDNLPLTHGTRIFINTKILNVLGYEAFLIGEGTTVDFTPPEPGFLDNLKSDIMVADGCSAAITQRCIEVTWKENHR